MSVLLATVMLKLLEPRNLLAILGGATLGYFAVHIITNVATRSVGVKVIPNIVLLFLRLLGAVLVGWVVALWVLGVGGTGVGGSGGLGFGEGQGNPLSPGKKDEVVIEKDQLKDLQKNKNPVPTGRYLYLEVLMNDEIKDVLKEMGPEAIQAKRYYRELKSLPTALMTLKEVREKLTTSQPPYDKIYVVLGKARSDPGVARVADLEDEARKLKIPSDRTSP